MRYTPLEKLACNSVKNFVVNFTNVTDERTNIQMDKQKSENYIPLGINAGGIIINALILIVLFIRFISLASVNVKASCYKILVIILIPLSNAN